MPKLEKITVHYEKKVSDGNYGSVAAGMFADLILEEGDDKNEVASAGYKWIRGQVEEQLDIPPASEQPATVAHNTEHAGMLEGNAKTFPVETISVNVYNGKKYAKAKGGNFAQYGVNVWPEVLSQPPLELDLEQLDPAEYPVQAGVTAIYVEKPHKDDPNKMVPDKVTGWA